MRARKAQELLGQSALQAYQADIPRGGDAPSPEDQVAVMVATLLRQSLLAKGPAGDRIRDEAVKIARASLGENALSGGCTNDDHPATTQADVIRLLVQRTDHSGRLTLAQHLLESLASLEADPIVEGRILNDRIRISRKFGHLDLAFEQAQELLRRGRSLHSPELLARAYTQLGAIAETRGNRSEFKVYAQRALRFAKVGGHRRIEAGSHGALGTANAMLGRYGDAIAHYWEAFRLSQGRGQVPGVVLGNLAQTLLHSGRPLEARKIAAMVLHEGPPPVNSLPALGCYALASANLSDAEAVKWACAQVRQIIRAPHHAREAAEALVECGIALEAIGQSVQGGVLRRRGESIATRYGFYDLTFDEAVLSAQRGGRPTINLRGAAANAAAQIVELEIPRIPPGFAMSVV